MFPFYIYPKITYRVKVDNTSIHIIDKLRVSTFGIAWRD